MNVSSRKGFLNSTISVDSLIQNRGSLSGCQPLDKELQATNDCRGGTKNNIQLPRPFERINCNEPNVIIVLGHFVKVILVSINNKCTKGLVLPARGTVRVS